MTSFNVNDKMSKFESITNIFLCNQTKISCTIWFLNNSYDDADWMSTLFENQKTMTE